MNVKRILAFGALAIVTGVTVSGAAFARGGAPATYGPSATVSSALASKLALARIATARYATDLGRAKADGYKMQITQMIPNMGFHFLNPAVKGFDVRKPAILVYVKRGGNWQLGALEWVFTKKPAKPPIEGATYGAFGAACHYSNGEFVPALSQDECAKTSPQAGAPFTFWHPALVTLHIWLWYPNPTGLYSGTNPLATPYNGG
jgi:hypothetical protein